MLCYALKHVSGPDAGSRVPRARAREKMGHLGTMLGFFDELLGPVRPTQRTIRKGKNVYAYTITVC